MKLAGVLVGLLLDVLLHGFEVHGLLDHVDVFGYFEGFGVDWHFEGPGVDALLEFFEDEIALHKLFAARYARTALNFLSWRVFGRPRYIRCRVIRVLLILHQRQRLLLLDRNSLTLGLAGLVRLLVKRSGVFIGLEGQLFREQRLQGNLLVPIQGHFEYIVIGGRVDLPLRLIHYSSK